MGVQSTMRYQQFIGLFQLYLSNALLNVSDELESKNDLRLTVYDWSWYFRKGKDQEEDLCVYSSPV